jgi:hypothetical protein
LINEKLPMEKGKWQAGEDLILKQTKKCRT